jgi:uncharacterized membrane protein YdbT with pleckstrin-like domain
MALDPTDKPKASQPDAREEKVGEHTMEQAETLLSEPILIPRNPISMNVRIIAVVFIADLVFIVMLVLLLGGLSFMGASLGSGIVIFIALLVIVRLSLLLMIIVKMATNWSETSFYLTDRAIIHRKGIANVYEDTYELANIRHVYMFQDFVGRMYDYGHIHLNIATRGEQELVRLTDIKSPAHYKTLFEKYLG